MNEGTIVQIIGPVIDIDFSGGSLPSILSAVRVPFKDAQGSTEDLIVEVQQHLGDNRVRTVAMDSTDGLSRGMKAFSTGEPIMVPVGPATLGRLINVVGKGIDGLGEIKSDNCGIPFTGPHRRLRLFRRRRSSSRPGSRSSTFWSRTPKVGRRDSSAAREWGRR